jgi:pyrroline-5-carboxylate reductase
LAKRDDVILVSMAAGIAIADIQRMAGKDYPVIRIMPNTPVGVGEGMVLYTVSENVTADMKAAFCDAMSGAGLLDEIPEKLIDAGSAVSGCGPAFACLFVEALADGGVACGLPRDKALTYAAQMLKGTAKLILESGEHPGKLKDAVCSPGGSTIAGVRALEQGNFRGSTMDAVDAAFYRTKELGK